MILRRHHRQLELIGALLRHGEADQAAAEARHEIDRLRRAHLCGDHKIAFVLAVLGIDKDEHAAVSGILDHVREVGDVIVEDVHDFANRAT